jgi:nicotinamidase/pyrazinamidase
MNERNPAAGAALVIIDVQNDFCPGGSLPIREGDQVVKPINRIAPIFSWVVATKDWHPLGHVSFATSHPGKKVMERIQAGAVDQLLWPDHCVQDTVGSDLHAGLDIKPVSYILHKGFKPDMDAYSAFFENDRQGSTGLEFLLKGLGCSRVFLCGLATDVCVMDSAMDALRIGFETWLVTDACRGIDNPPGTLAKSLAAMREAGVQSVSADEILGWAGLRDQT